MTTHPPTQDHDKANTAAAAIGLDLFYPIVPDADWVRRIVPLGVKTIQLRIKDATPETIRNDITGAIKVCKTNDCQLIVNDYWREAIDLGADFIHLGQEDLATADINAIKAAGLRLGISTHDETELKIALARTPDYIALGPIYKTKLKAMAWAPQGLDKITRWAQLIGTIPLVGIGGLTIERATAVIDAGAQSASVVTDFIYHSDPESRVNTWIAWARTTKR